MRYIRYIARFLFFIIRPNRTTPIAIRRTLIYLKQAITIYRQLSQRFVALLRKRQFIRDSRKTDNDISVRSVAQYPFIITHLITVIIPISMTFIVNHNICLIARTDGERHMVIRSITTNRFGQIGRSIFPFIVAWLRQSESHITCLIYFHATVHNIRNSRIIRLYRKW